jgi:hypothetical protein
MSRNARCRRAGYGPRTCTAAAATGKYRPIPKRLRELRCPILFTHISEGVLVAQSVRFVPTGELRAYLAAQNSVVGSLAARRQW